MTSETNRISVPARTFDAVIVVYLTDYLDCHPVYPKDSPYDHRVIVLHTAQLEIWNILNLLFS